MWCDLLSREQSGLELFIGALGLWPRSEGMELNLTYSNYVHIRWLAFILNMLCFLCPF